jgi:rhodanese-related sulfurtransferase
MKKIKIVTIFLGLAIVFKMATASDLQSISPLDAYKLQQENKSVIIDVREMDEVKEGKVKGAQVIPMSLMSQNATEFEHVVNNLPKDKKIIVYCRSGRRSGIVGEELLKRKLQVENMKAFDDWKAAGLPVE